jgi:ribonucleoside-triphosphate reductase
MTSTSCYNSYIYAVEKSDTTIIDKFLLHGKETTEFLDGGAALHINLDDYLTADQYLKLMEVAAKVGCNFWTVNIKITICCDCGMIEKKTVQKCPKCGGMKLDYATRIIGYLKRISNFSKDRQTEESLRHYHHSEAL